MLLGFIVAGGIVTAILSENILVMWIGIFTSVGSLISGFLTNSEIDDLKEKSKSAVYCEECDDFHEFEDVEKLFANDDSNEKE